METTNCKQPQKADLETKQFLVRAFSKIPGSFVQLWHDFPSSWKEDTEIKRSAQHAALRIWNDHNNTSIRRSALWKILLQSAKQNSCDLVHRFRSLPDEDRRAFQTDASVMLRACEKDFKMSQFLPDQFSEDINFLRSVLENNPKALYYLPESSQHLALQIAQWTPDSRAEQLPEPVLRNVFTLLGAHKDLKNCERCCKTFNSILSKGANNSIWEQDDPSLQPDGVQSLREYSGILYNIEQARLLQATGESLIVQVLGGDGLKEYLTRMVLVLDPTIFYAQWRGDTLALIAELLEAFMIQKIQDAYKISVGRGGSVYPTLESHDFAYNPGKGEGPRFCVGTYHMGTIGGRGAVIHTGEFNAAIRNQLHPEIGHQMIRKLALRAGVIKMSKESFETCRKLFIEVTAGLLRQAHTRAEHSANVGDEVVHDFDFALLENGGEIDMWETPVPGLGVFQGVTYRLGHYPGRGLIIPNMVEAAARDLGLDVHSVASREWVATDGRTEEEERSAALKAYETQNLNSVPSDCWSQSSWDTAYEESSDESSAYSVYSETSHNY